MSGDVVTAILDPPQLFTSADVLAETGVTARQLDHWVQTGVVVPTVRAHGYPGAHGWSANDIRAVRTVKQLRDHVGLGLGGVDWGHLGRLIRDNTCGWLIIRPDSLTVTGDPETARDLQLCGGVAVCIRLDTIGVR